MKPKVVGSYGSIFEVSGYKTSFFSLLIIVNNFGFSNRERRLFNDENDVASSEINRFFSIESSNDSSYGSTLFVCREKCAYLFFFIFDDDFGGDGGRGGSLPSNKENEAHVENDVETNRSRKKKVCCLFLVFFLFLVGSGGESSIMGKTWIPPFPTKE